MKSQQKYGENPFYTFLTVHVDYKEFDDVYITRCTGAGFPLPKVSLKHEGKVVATSVENPQVIYRLTRCINVTCEVSNTCRNQRIDHQSN